MRQDIRSALLLLLWMTVLTGLVYPLAVTGIAGVLFPDRARGSLVEVEGKVMGSELIGQEFSDPGHFWGRLSATSPAYNGAASTGSNLGPSNPALTERVQARLVALREAEPGNANPIPVDLATASGSGLDPHITPAAALFQVPRVARIRDIGEEQLRALVTVHTEGRQFGILGEPRVNVLRLNLALDALESPR